MTNWREVFGRRVEANILMDFLNYVYVVITNSYWLAKNYEAHSKGRLEEVQSQKISALLKLLNGMIEDASSGYIDMDIREISNGIVVIEDIKNTTKVQIDRSGAVVVFGDGEEAFDNVGSTIGEILYNKALEVEKRIKGNR